MKSIKLIYFDYHKSVNGDLVVVEGHSANVTFSIARIFNVVNPVIGSLRGRLQQNGLIVSLVSIPLIVEV